LIGQNVSEGPTINPGPTGPETAPWDVGVASFTVGQHIKAGGDDLGKELGTIAATIEDDRDPPLAQQGANLCQYPRQHLDQASVGFRCDHKERVPGRVVDPVIRSGGQRDPQASHMRLGQAMLAVVDPHVAVNVEEAQRGAA